MKIINKSKITNLLNFNLKLIVLSSLLFSQLSLSEIFLYQNHPDALSINIAKADAWYNAGWAYRKAITIDHTRVAQTDQSNFPVLISLTDISLKYKDYSGGKVQNVSGFDIVFSQDGVNKLDHEIESYDSANGRITMWVKIPLLSHVAPDTVIYMYYGNSSINSTLENVSGVWNDGELNNFKGVWHMEEDPFGSPPQILDSVGNVNDGTSGGTMLSEDLVDGKINKTLDFDGTDDKVEAVDRTVGSVQTVSAWLRVDPTNEGAAVSFTHSGITGYMGYTHYITPTAFKFQTSTGGGGANAVWSINHGVDATAWHLWTYERNGTSVSLYIDGAYVGGATILNPVSTIFSGFGVRAYAGPIYKYFKGSIDEVRISNIARSAGWISTEYNNQSNSAPGFGNFILPLGGEEVPATSYDFTAPSPSSGLVNTPSQNFTITPNGVYTGTITITPSGGGLSNTITKTFTNSSSSQTFTITPTIAGTVTLTLTNSGGFTNPSPVTYTSISISASPSSVIQSSTNNSITLTGINTSWTAGSPGVPTFTLSGGTGAAITSQTVTDSTHVTITLNAGSTAGDLTITDPSTGATTIVSVIPSTSNLITSFNLSTPATTGTINDTNHTVSLTVPYGTNITSLTPTITVSANATISPASGTSHNFTNPATYTVTAQDGSTTQDYTVTITVSPSTGGGFISPTQPIIPIQDNRIDISNLSPDIIQIAISRTPDFKDVSWEVFSDEEIKQLDNCPDKLYIKFRNKSGAVSAIITYIPKTTNDTKISNLKDGDVVKTINNPDVYIIKIKNGKQYKRLILSPSVFQSYGHLKWSNLKIISQEELNQYTTSNLVKETTDAVIYALFPNGDRGERVVFDISRPYDTDSVYEINKTDRDSYGLIE